MEPFKVFAFHSLLFQMTGLNINWRRDFADRNIFSAEFWLAATYSAASFDLPPYYIAALFDSPLLYLYIMDPITPMYPIPAWIHLHCVMHHATKHEGILVCNHISIHEYNHILHFTMVRNASNIKHIYMQIWTISLTPLCAPNPGVWPPCAIWLFTSMVMGAPSINACIGSRRVVYF